MDPNAPSREDPVDTQPAHYFDNAPFSFNRMPFRCRDPPSRDGRVDMDPAYCFGNAPFSFNRMPFRRTFPPSPLPTSSFASDYLPSPGDPKCFLEYKMREYDRDYKRFCAEIQPALAFAPAVLPDTFPVAVPQEPTRALWEATAEPTSEADFSSTEYYADSESDALTLKEDDSDSGSDSDSGGGVLLTLQEDGSDSDSDSDSDGGVLLTLQEDGSDSDSDSIAILTPREDGSDDSDSDSDSIAILTPQEDGSDDSDSDSDSIAILTPQEDGSDDSDSDGQSIPTALESILTALESFLTALEDNSDSDSNGKPQSSKTTSVVRGQSIGHNLI